MRSRNGAFEPYSSPLEARITVPYRHESGYETIMRIAVAIDPARSRSAGFGRFPMNLFLHSKVGIEARDARARDVLWRTLRAIRPGLSWRLLCGVDHAWPCLLNVHAVAEKMTLTN